METTAVKLYSTGYREAKTYLAAALFVAGNIVLPQICHLVPQGGLRWLPIYFFTLVGAYKYGWRVGLLTALLSPVVNSALFGMPAAAMLPVILLKSVLLKEEDAIKVSFDSKNAMFQLKNHTLVCRLIEGNYPNYNAVIPTANPNKVLVDRIELVNGIKRVAVCSNPTTNLIRMDIADNRINLTAQDIDFSVSANETISCSYEGQNITIGFKSTFLVEILSNIDTPTIVIELADSTRAGVFKPVYDDKQSSATLMLLMPMMINA